MKNPYAGIPNSVWMINLAAFISKSGNVVLVFLPFYLTTKLSFDLASVGQILSLYGLGTVIGAFSGGHLSSKFSCLNIQNFCLFFAGLIYLSIEHFRNFFSIAVLVFFAGMLTSAIRPAMAELIAALSPPKVRARSYGLYHQAVNIGNTIGPAIGGLLSELSYEWMFRLDGIANTLAALFVFFYFRKSDVKKISAHSESASLNVSLFKDTYFLMFLFLSLCIGISFFHLLGMYSVYLKNVYLISGFQFGMLMAINGAMIVILQMPLLYFFQHHNLLRLIATGAFLIGVGFFILPFYQGYYYAIFSMIIITFGEMIALPLMTEFVARRAPVHKRAKYFGIYTCIFSLPLLLCPSIASYFFEHFGPNTLWICIGILSSAVSLALINMSVIKQKSTFHDVDKIKESSTSF